MSFIKVCENFRVRFLLKFEKCVERISSRSNRLGTKRTKKVEVHNGLRKLDSAWNYVYENKTGYKIASVISMIAFAERSRVPVVQHIVVEYVKERSCESCRRGFLKPLASADRIGLRAHASMVRVAEKPTPLESTSTKSGLSKPETTSSVELRKLL